MFGDDVSFISVSAAVVSDRVVSTLHDIAGYVEWWTLINIEWLRLLLCTVIHQARKNDLTATRYLAITHHTSVGTQQ